MVKNKVKSVRLSKYIVPKKYSITLAPDLENFISEGAEEIVLDIQKPMNKITLHSAELEILSVELVRGKKKLVGKVSYNEKEETATFAFPSKVSEGKAVLKLKFTGILNDKLRGFYRSRYEVDGKTHHMAVTQFESTDARRAIPCFDEPAQKAVFEVTLKVPSDRTAISNTIETEIAEHEGSYKVVKFAPSPKMSSYLLAFIIGHFEHVENKTETGVLVRVFVTPGKKHQAEFALDVAIKCIEFYEQYFGIKYPLPVLDLIAIPDFAAGAMENWGAVTYRETAILVDPEHSSTQNKQWVALVVAHELAHQWFGNLVTMEWWTHLWLNEGFASYMEYVAIDYLFPKWNIWTQFVFIEHARGLALDGLANTHAIEVDVYHPAEISEIFDAVSYSKGASVIRMLAEYLGEKDFRLGLKSYLKKHAYANASTNDLWEALEKPSGKPIRRIMQNWTRRPGYPLITVSSKKNRLELSQSRFFSSSNVKTQDKTLWLIPISIVGSDQKKPKYTLLTKKKSSLSLKFQKWVEINTRETSFIRVSYSPKLLELLDDPIKNKKISQEGRFGIVRDAFALSQSSAPLSTDIALGIAASYKKEDSYIVWAELASQMLKLSNLLHGQNYHGLFEEYARSLFEGIAKRVGWSKKQNEDYNTTLLRSIIIYALGTNGDLRTIKTARRMFNLGKNIDADLRGVVYRLVAENGNKKDYDKLLSLYKKTQLAEEKDRVLRALCSFNHRELLKRTLEFAFSKEARDQDLLKAFAFVWVNPRGRGLAWEYLKKKWPWIVEKFGGGHLFSKFVSPIDNFVTNKEADEAEEFFKKNSALGIERTVAQALEQIRSNAAWLKRDSNKIQKFLQE